MPASLTSTVIGLLKRPLASAPRSSRPIALWTSGAFTRGAWITTCAGTPSPGNAAWACFRVFVIASPCGSPLMPELPVFMPSAGIVSAISTATEATVEIPG